MGGHAAGNVASGLAVDTLRAAFTPAPPAAIRGSDLARRLSAAFDDANAAILRYAERQADCAGMGTTLTAVAPLPHAPCCVIAHMGDSRAYRYRRSGPAPLTQLTRDHTWVQRQVEAGMLTAAEARHHPMSSVLSRVLGTEAAGPADTLVIDVEPGDLLLLCSDGLTGELADAEIAALLEAAAPAAVTDAAARERGADNRAVRGAGDRTVRDTGNRGVRGGAARREPDRGALKRCARALIDAANARGGRDNITVLLLAVQP